MKSIKAKKYKFWYQVFLIVGLLSLLDMSTRPLVGQSYEGIGYIGVGAFFIFTFLFGAQVASMLLMWLYIIFSFFIIWFIIAYFLNQKSKVIENPTEENQKKFKRAKIITWIFVAIALFPVLFSIYLASS